MDEMSRLCLVNIESLLEDLEAHFDAQAKASIKTPEVDLVNLIRTINITSEVQELTAPLIGRDFVAGFLDGGSNWLILRHQWIQSLESFHRLETNHPIRSFTKKTFQEVIQTMSLPAEISWRHLYGETQQTHRGIAVNCSNGFLELSSLPVKSIPLNSLGQILVRVVENY